MRLVLDTNVLIAAFVSRGSCTELFEHCARMHELFSSLFMLDEFGEKLVTKIGASRAEARAARRLVESRSEVVKPVVVAGDACRGPDDLPVLGTALAAHARALITGDRDLLTLGRHARVRILAPRDFWRFEAQQGRKIRSRRG